MICGIVYSLTVVLIICVLVDIIFPGTDIPTDPSPCFIREGDLGEISNLFFFERGLERN
jgi:hypothetical protein